MSLCVYSGNVVVLTIKLIVFRLLSKLSKVACDNNVKKLFMFVVSPLEFTVNQLFVAEGLWTFRPTDISPHTRVLRELYYIAYYAYDVIEMCAPAAPPIRLRIRTLNPNPKP